MVLRTRTNVEAREAQRMAEVIEQYLSERTVNTIVKQRWVDRVAGNRVNAYDGVQKLIKQTHITLESSTFNGGPVNAKPIIWKQFETKILFTFFFYIL